MATRPEGAVEVKYEAQVVRHKPDEYRPGAATELALGILVVRQLAVSGASPTAKAVAATGLVAGADLLGASGRLHSATNTEVIITTSLIDNNRFLMRKTDVYYVEDAECVMFEAPFRPLTKNMEVTG